MSATTVLKLGVDLLEKSVNFAVNCLILLGYRIEAERGLKGYMTRNQEWIERGIRTWVSEQKLLSLHYEIYDEESDKAYERCQIDLKYFTNPQGQEVVKPPVEQLEALLRQLEKLPPTARFRVVAMKAPGASEVEGWVPTTLREFLDGDPEDIEVGDKEHGFGHIWSRIVYKVAKRYAKKQNQTHEFKLR
jgi:hypothetical protein